MVEVTSIAHSFPAEFESIIGDIVSQNLAVALFALIGEHKLYFQIPYHTYCLD